MNAKAPSFQISEVFLKRSSIVQVCLCIAYSLIRPFVPTRRNQVAFASVPDCADNARALFEWMMRSQNVSNYQLVWLVHDTESAQARLRRTHPGLAATHVRVVRKNSLAGIFSFMRSRYVFFTHGVYRFAHAGSHQIVVNLWHGMPIKKIGMQLQQRYLLEPAFAHYTIATSQFFAEIIARSLRVPRSRVLITGLPRNQWLFDIDDEHAGLKEGRSRMVVWLPTYRSGEINGYVLHDASGGPDPLSAGRLRELDSKLEGAGVLVVLKLHPLDVRNRAGWPGYRNIRVMKDSDFRTRGLNAYKMLACADALITDFSSIAIDYLILGRPIGIFAPDKSAYTRGLVPGVFEKLSSIGYWLDSTEAIAAFARHLPNGHRSPAEVDVLHQGELRDPAAAILRAVGLEELCSIRHRAPSSASSEIAEAME